MTTATQPANGEVPMAHDELEALMDELKNETEHMMQPHQAQALVAQDKPPVIDPVDNPEAGVHADATPPYVPGAVAATITPREERAAAPPLVTEGPLLEAARRRAAAAAGIEIPVSNVTATAHVPPATMAELRNAPTTLVVPPATGAVPNLSLVRPVVTQQPQPAAPTQAAAPAESDEPKLTVRPLNDFGLSDGGVKFRQDTAVTDNNLDQSFQNQHGLRSYYIELAAQAEAQASRVKAECEMLEASLNDRVRRKLLSSEDKVTERVVEVAVKMHPYWLRIKYRLADAETIARIAKGQAQSMEDRKDMIVQMGSDRREEMKGAPRIRSAR